MSSHFPSQELSLSPAYRNSLRLMAQWLEHAPPARHRHRFALRQQLAQLDSREAANLTRWLAWWCLAAQSHGRAGQPMLRLQRLDASLARRTAAIVPCLPGLQPPPTLQKSA